MMMMSAVNAMQRLRLLPLQQAMQPMLKQHLKQWLREMKMQIMRRLT
jgi:hypothetical protein